MDHREPWRERPLNGAWARFIAPRRGRSRHGSSPSLDRNRCQGRHTTPPHVARVTNRNALPLHDVDSVHGVRHDTDTGLPRTSVAENRGAETVQGPVPPAVPVSRPPSRLLAVLIPWL